jgi:Arc/MetJ-type ribon-helix-helix transcriptional regulator
MQIQLRAEQAAFVQALVAEGLFSFPEEAIEAALSLLQDQYELYRIKQAELKKLVRVGVEQADRGETAPLDMQAILAKALERTRELIAVGVRQLEAGQVVAGEEVFRKLKDKVRQRSGQSA